VTRRIPESTPCHEEPAPRPSTRSTQDCDRANKAAPAPRSEVARPAVSPTGRSERPSTCSAGKTCRASARPVEVAAAVSVRRHCSGGTACRSRRVPRTSSAARRCFAVGRTVSRTSLPSGGGGRGSDGRCSAVDEAHVRVDTWADLAPGVPSRRPDTLTCGTRPIVQVHRNRHRNAASAAGTWLW